MPLRGELRSVRSDSWTEYVQGKTVLAFSIFKKGLFLY